MGVKHLRFTVKELLAVTAVVAACVFIALRAGWTGGTGAAACAAVGLVGYFGRRYRSGLVSLAVGWVISMVGAFGYFTGNCWTMTAALEFTLSSSLVLMIISTCRLLIAWAVGRVARFAVWPSE